MNFSFTRKKDAVAFDIGSNSIKLVQMNRAKKGWELIKMGMAELPPEAIVDGSIIDSMTVTNTLRDLVKEHGVKVKDAVSSLTGHSVIIKKVSFPAMTEDELADSIQWEAEQYIPFPISDVNIDFQILGADSEGRGQMDVMLVAVKKDVINDYTNVIKEAGLNPVVIDVDSFALENMMEINYPIAPGENIAMVNIGASITSISVILGGLTIFTRSIPMGGNQFTEEIQRQLSVSFRDAEDLKTGRKAASEQESSELASSVGSVSTNLTFEVKRSLDFFLGGAQGSYVSKIYLSGGGSKVAGLQNLMQDKTSIPVEVVNPFKSIEASSKQFDRERLKEAAPFFGVAVGLATRRFADR
ncbi:MAG TPA: pilus assembly protein PilM [Deltaproteobacteria bacterium]|nr:MAG: pilus assembly protein PilM [Deltaproteobacteria bacterium GWA2_55_82]OGQ62380.1 MAG: pilus assembly protein PilM [Deltaproteobacteria bacterium RIFCSPLOWO2_02_FULL_55_12]OIJ73292.1 MAG: pilus assembly protein PilM [Deltaproteobacteria bacterium GWC2_55_46]HBG45440.1 pilus assembly protein PilM [Deltaproteobacteria bacterium]HCY10271.1 pilus assembly protein PilM [Deltaproteobacteria bacterium]